MTPEIEVKFLSIDMDDVRSKLQAIGAKCDYPMRLMHRATIKRKGELHNNSFARIRDEGNKITFTYKQFDNDNIDGTKEIETTVGDFESALNIIKKMGDFYITLQESKRETWTFGNVEIVIDIWPWCNPYIEIEGESEDAIKTVATRLGFDWKHAIYGSVMRTYEAQYPHIKNVDFLLSDLPEVRFDMPLPDVLKGVK